MNLVPFLTFFAIMLALAAIPSASVGLVVSRSATLGFRNGAAVAGGIVLGDLALAALAIYGMSSLAESMGSLFFLVRCLAGSYLIWIGIGLLRAREDLTANALVDKRPLTLASSFLSGLFLTFGDLKAILFYASLFPTLFNLRLLTSIDIGIIATITIITVGGVKLIYAYAARTFVARWKSRRVQRITRKAAGGLMIGAGSYVILKA
jgi:threonine/homoserine/homoserine lactone efflux protein